MHSDIIIIGSGPAGMEAAAIALRQGLNVTLIERDEWGGTCLNRGCIPTKALCHSAMLSRVTCGKVTWNEAIRRKDSIVAEMRANVEASLSKANLVKGEARFVNNATVEVDGQLYTAPKIIIATGSTAARLPIEGAELAVDSDSLLAMSELPKSIVVIGGGVIGMEMACILKAFGVEVSVLEYGKEILPGFDRDIAKRLRTSLTRSGMNIMTGAEVTSIHPGKKVIFNLKGKECEVSAEEVFMAVGRKPVVPTGATEAGILVDRGRIQVTPGSFSTSLPGVYAVGDVNAVMMLAHVASAQASVVMGRKMNLDVVPSVAFTVPECAMVGLTEEACREKELPVKVVKLPFRSNGKAVTAGEADGMIKLIVNSETRLLEGCHFMAHHAADLVAEAALAMANGLTVDNIVSTIHAHPTLSEALHDAAELI